MRFCIIIIIIIIIIVITVVVIVVQAATVFPYCCPSCLGLSLLVHMCLFHSTFARAYYILAFGLLRQHVHE
jgi:hypothetical protein